MTEDCYDFVAFFHGVFSFVFDYTMRRKRDEVKQNNV